MKRVIIFALLLVLAIGFAAPHFEIEFFRPKIARALERGLGRKVEVGPIHFNLFTGPGFTVDDVTIHEDVRAGIEPFAYVGKLEARVQLLSLLRHRLDFSSLRLIDASINLVKTDAGPWNFQFLLNSAPASAGAMPAIKMRGGRVNFKFGDTKSVFYFDNADLDVSPSMDGSAELRFVGAPSRSDHAGQNFGLFSVRGRWSAQRVDMKVELEKSALEEVARLIDRRGFGLHGVIALDAQLSGVPAHLDVTGNIQVIDVHRWDLLPQSGGGLRVGYKGTLDLHNDRLELESVSDVPNPQIAAAFRAWDFLSAPHWDARAELKRLPVATALEIAQHMGAGLPDNLAAEGSLSGEVRYSDQGGSDSDQGGIAGRVALQDASVTLPDGRPLRAASAAVVIDHQVMSLEPATVSVGESESADVEGSFSLAGAASLDLKITTRALSVSEMRSFGVAAIPLLDQTPQGTWRGWARYQWARDEVGQWSGEYELQNARIPVDGLVEPVKVQSAFVNLNGKRVTVNRLHAKVGAIAFTGDYRWEPAAIHPHKFHLTIPEADAAELQRVLAPALVRNRGFFARTLRFGDAPVPEWMQTRRADGTVAIAALSFGETVVRVDSARLLWDAAEVRLSGLSAHLNDSALTGDLTVDLTGHVPHYRFDGKLENVAYKDGRLDFEGSLEADGAGADILSSAHAEGRLRGRSIAFSPEAEFRTAAACFEVSEQTVGERWKLSSVEVTQGPDAYTGSGATQGDGRIVLDLLTRGRQVRYSALLASTQ